MVSVVIPTYNHAHTVGDAIASAEAQRGVEIEVIVVNDGSPDDTVDRLRPWIDDGRIRYTEQPNQGQAAARNTGAAMAQGEFIAFLDDDDRWPDDKLAWQAKALERRSDAVLAYGDYARIEPDGTISGPVHTRCPAGSESSAFREACWITSLGQTLIRRSALDKAGPFDETIWGSDDWDMYLRLVALGPFVHERRVALFYRIHEGNASRGAVRHVRGHFQVMKKHMGCRPVSWVSHFRHARGYFVPRLLQAAHEHRLRGERRQALRAYAYAGAFQPAIMLRRSTWAPIGGIVLGRPPRRRNRYPAQSRA